jgi:1-acyl-sn-glycerol-3-phosphate acyltransferase
MIKTAFWVIRLFFDLLLRENKLKKAEHLLKDGKTEEHAEFAYDTVRDWAHGVLKSAGAKVNVHGLENLPDGNMLFVSNHQSNFDIPLLLAEIPVPKGFIAKKELAKVPFISSWMKQINCLFMDRSDMKQSMQIILEGIKLLKGGYSMVVFPEGTRSKGGPVAEFKAGSFKLAIKSKVPIVPITIDGTYKLLEGNGNRIKPAEINLYIHKPIDVTALNKDELADLHNAVRDVVISEL